MAKKLKKSANATNSVLLQLYDNRLLAVKVDSALDMGRNYNDIVAICKSQDLDISLASISRYAKARKEAIRTGQDLRLLLDGNKRRKLETIRKKEVKATGIDLTPITGGDAVLPQNSVTPDVPTSSGQVTKYISDMDVLDSLISRGMESIINLDAPVAPKDMLKAIEVKAKLTNNANAGLSIEGLQELRVRTTARDNAVAQALLKFVPQDKQAEAMQYINDAEEEMLQNMDASQQGRQILKALKDSGIKL